MALEADVPVIPVVMIGTEKVNPIGSKIWRPHRIKMVIGRPLDFSRYEGMAGDRFVERSMTDEIMYRIMELSGQEYVDVYAAKVKADAEARPRSRRGHPDAGPRPRHGHPPAGHQGRLRRRAWSVPHPNGPVARYFYDCEFIEDGRTIELISIGVIAEDGREFYAVSTEFDPDRANAWVRRHVLASCRRPPTRPGGTAPAIRDELYAFLAAPGLPIELWAWYAAYDHVVLAQLWGTMPDLPRGRPAADPGDPPALGGGRVAADPGTRHRPARRAGGRAPGLSALAHRAGRACIGCSA